MMTLYEFMNFLKTITEINEKFTVEFTLVDDDGGSTFEIHDMHDFGALLQENISLHRLRENEYRVSLSKIIVE